MNRVEDVTTFYDVLSILESRLGGKRLLGDCHGRMAWPKRGVYFFFEEGEQRLTSGEGLRVVRVGTHAVSERSKTILWNRLSNHRGPVISDGGNHRGSVFRRILGDALAAISPTLGCSSWGKGMTASREVRDSEIALERLVSQHIRKMQVLWVEADDEPSKNSARKFIERNSIALLSNYRQEEKVDPSSSSWLGAYSISDRVRISGLWNSDHVDEVYDPSVLVTFRELVQRMKF